MSAAKMFHGEVIPEGWFKLDHDDTDSLYFEPKVAGYHPRISALAEGGWALTRIIGSQGFNKFVKVSILFTAPTVAACAAWWEIERSNMPEPKLSYADIRPVRNSTKAVMDAMRKKHGAKTMEELNELYGGPKP